MEYVITADGPVPMKAFLTKDLGSVAIKFNKNIQGVKKTCQSVFSSLNILGKGKLRHNIVFNFKVEFRRAEMC